MMQMHDDKVSYIYECNLIYGIINSPKRKNVLTSITLLSYMNVWIIERVNKILRTFESYCTGDLVTRL